MMISLVTLAMNVIDIDNSFDVVDLQFRLDALLARERMETDGYGDWLMVIQSTSIEAIDEKKLKNF